MFGWLKTWLRGTTAAPAPEVVEERKPMRISLGALAEARASGGAALQPFTIPARPPWLKQELAMDAINPGLSDLYAWAAGGAVSEGLAFLGYPYLAELSQRPEYRRVSEIYASEATRKWIKLNSTDEDRKTKIEKALVRFNIRQRFREASEHDGFFGRGQIFVDLGHQPNDAELGKALPANKAKIGVGSVKNFKVVEPFWCYPGAYDSTNPLAPDYYEPRFWSVFSSQVHRDRLLMFTSREVPDILKPSYQFGGLSLSQMVKPYVDNWIRTRQSVSDLLHSFSTMVLGTDLSTILGGGGAEDLIARAQLFNQTRDNRGLMMINKDSEELANVTTPLTTLDALLAQSQEQMASVSGVPLVVLLGVTPSGLNASSDGEIRTFYANIKTYQERLFRAPLQRVLEIIQLDLDGKIDPELTFEFIDLWEMPETEKAVVRKTNADIDVAYVAAGVVSNEEVRERLAEDEESPYFGVDLAPAAPDMSDVDQEEGDAPTGTAQDEAPPRAAGCVLVEPKGRVLLLRRSANAKDHPETWCFPGGMIDPGETPQEAARRETIEEAGYDVGALYDAKYVCANNGFVTYARNVATRFMPVLNDEHTAFVWARLDNLPEPMHPHMDFVFSRLLDRNG